MTGQICQPLTKIFAIAGLLLITSQLFSEQVKLIFGLAKHQDKLISKWES